jgi:hypothetical protein
MDQAGHSGTIVCFFGHNFLNCNTWCLKEWRQKPAGLSLRKSALFRPSARNEQLHKAASQDRITKQPGEERQKGEAEQKGEESWTRTFSRHTDYF